MDDSSSKKRKRQSNGTTSPNKRLSSLPDSQINVRHLAQNGVHPALVAAQGINIPSISFKAYAKPQRESEGGIVAPKSHSAILQSSNHPRLNYTALPNSKSDNLAHYAAIYDPETSTLEITPVYHTQLQAVVRERPEDKEQTPTKTPSQQRIQLGQEFGTKKAKKAIASRTINAITNGEADSKEGELRDAILDAAAEEAGQAEDAAAQLRAILSAKPIPMPNLEADSVEQVYSINDLFPAHLRQHVDVKEWREKARADENIEAFHRYPAYHVQDIGKGENRVKLKALSYMALLLRFHDALRPAGRSGKKVPKHDILMQRLDGYTQPLVNAVQKQYSDDKFELTKWHIEKLHTTLCALSLYIDDYVTDTSALRDDLKLDNKIISRYFQELGCKVRPMTEAEIAKKKMTKAEAALVRMAVLRLPLDFPKLRSGRRK